MTEVGLKIYPEPFLRSAFCKMSHFGEDDLKHALYEADRLTKWMHELKGIGLAANQVGMFLRMFVFVSNQFDRDMVIANPDIIWTEGENKDREACLSVPGYSAVISRPSIIGIKYFDLYQEKVVFQEFGGRDARVVQHETDHLNGMLFIDHLSPLKRKMFEKKYAKMKKQGRIPKC